MNFGCRTGVMWSMGAFVCSCWFSLGQGQPEVNFIGKKRVKNEEKEKKIEKGKKLKAINGNSSI